MKEVPYSRLIEASAANLPTKLDSDSKLHAEKSKLTVSGDVDLLPKNSVSDSKLAVDYFSNAQPEIKEIYTIANQNSTGSDVSAIHRGNVSFNASESHHSLGETKEERLRLEVIFNSMYKYQNNLIFIANSTYDVHIQRKPIGGFLLR